MRLIWTCRASSRLLSDTLERPLSRAERTALRFHLVLCRHCRRFRRNLQNLRMMARHLTAPGVGGVTLVPKLSDEGRARITRTVTRAQSEES